MVVVNDGGDPDEVESLVRCYADAAKERIRVVHNPKSLGMEGASRTGLAAIDSDLLIFHDDDDAWAPSFLEVTTSELVQLQEKFPRTQGVATYSHRVLETVRGNLIEIDGVDPFNSWAPPGFLSLDRMLAGNFIPPISFLFTTKAYREAGSVYEAIPYLGDWDFLVRVLSRYDVYLIPQFLAFYHWRHGSEPGGFNNSVTAEVDRHKFYRQFLLNAWLREDFTSGKAGIGTYANLRMHIETLLAQTKPPDKNADGKVELYVQDSKSGRWLYTDNKTFPLVCDLAANAWIEYAPVPATPAATSQQAVYVQEPKSGNWLYTDNKTFPRVYDITANRWIEYASVEGLVVDTALQQAVVDYYWNSASWRALKPVRSFANRLLGLPPEKKPEAANMEQAWRIARELQESWSWNLMAPLRCVQAGMRFLRRSRNG